MTIYNLVVYTVTVLIVLAALAGCATAPSNPNVIAVPDRAPDHVIARPCEQGVAIIGLYDMDGNVDNGYELQVVKYQGQTVLVLEFAAGDRGELLRATFRGRPYTPGQLRSAFPSGLCAALETT